MKSFCAGLCIFLVLAAGASSCKSQKKPKCNTCPKWDDKITIISAQHHDQEQHRSGERP